MKITNKQQEVIEVMSVRTFLCAFISWIFVVAYCCYYCNTLIVAEEDFVGKVVGVLLYTIEDHPLCLTLFEGVSACVCVCWHKRKEDGKC